MGNSDHLGHKLPGLQVDGLAVYPSSYPEKFHPHIHAIVSDGVFARTGTSCVMPMVDLKPLEETFRASVFKMLKEEGKIGEPW